MKDALDWTCTTLALSVVLALAGCGRAPETSAAATASTAAATAAPPASAATSSAAARPDQEPDETSTEASLETGTKPVQGDAASPYAFSVDITLSPPAAQQLSRHRETIKLAAFYYGLPKPGLPEGIDNEMGQVFLGETELEIPGADGRADFDGKGVQTSRLRYIEGEPQINLNVYSGRRSSEDNLLDCDFFEDAVRVAHAAPLKIHCKLIRE
ncbi:MAG: hypothetical protein K8F33_09485 [Thermomonas sp.]|uniref:hypothetical protein n=1 Tax=Thermomonas sp. TaxID=1971895 RepID=UPI001DDA3CC3|nr:hypothetical protein [Thermomonas sp.]MBZ0088314.1 hypothetical protein [Thermomonas sp.]